MDFFCISFLKYFFKDALKTTGVFALPQYLKANSTDPKIQWTMLGMEDVMWGRSIALKGQLGLVYVFQVDGLLIYVCC